MTLTSTIQRIVKASVASTCALGIVYPQFLSTTISPSEWGIKSFSNIEVAQVSIMQDLNGKSLHVYVLRDTVPPLPATVPQGRTPSFIGNYFVISDFEYGQINALGGVFNAFQKEPSSARADLANGGDGRRVLRLAFDKKSQGFCGVWVNLFNSFGSPGLWTYLNAKPFAALSFWVRGETGTEKVALKLADANWLMKDDAVPIGDLGNFISSGRIDTAWQPAVIPLDKIPSSLDISKLSSIVLEAESIGKGIVEIKTLAFCVDRQRTPPFPGRSIVPSVEKTQKAIWVWKTKDLSASGKKGKELFHFLKEHEFSEVYLGLPYDSEHARRTGSIRVDQNQLRPLVARLRQLGMNVHALIGDRNFALPEWHPFVKATVENIIRYNAESKPSDRFVGIHLDIEPYLLPGFNSPKRNGILQSYLELLADVSRQAHRANLKVAADIPFWYGTPDEFTRERGDVVFQGSNKPVNNHILDVVDEVVVMSYRTISSGMDGIVYHSMDEIAYALNKGKEVFVGLETGQLPDEEILTFRGKPLAGLGPVTASADQLFLVAEKDGATVYLVSSHDLSQFAEFLTQKGMDQRKMLRWPYGSRMAVPGAKLSFASLGAERMHQAMKETVLELGQYKSFRGFAIHYYDSYKKMLKKTVQ